MKVHVIRIGQITDRYIKKIEWQKDGDGRMITTPPQLSGLRLQQQSFWKIMDPFIWTFVIENCMDVKEGDAMRIHLMTKMKASRRMRMKMMRTQPLTS